MTGALCFSPRARSNSKPNPFGIRSERQKRNKMRKPLSVRNFRSRCRWGRFRSLLGRDSLSFAPRSLDRRTRSEHGQDHESDGDTGAVNPKPAQEARPIARGLAVDRIELLWTVLHGTMVWGKNKSGRPLPGNGRSNEKRRIAQERRRREAPNASAPRSETDPGAGTTAIAVMIEPPPISPIMVPCPVARSMRQKVLRARALSRTTA